LYAVIAVLKLIITKMFVTHILKRTMTVFNLFRDGHTLARTKKN
jgi:hypothetical protein